jgi:hypothetical protein
MVEFVTGITAALGFIALGLGVFVLGSPAPRFPPIQPRAQQSTGHTARHEARRV